MSAQENNGVKSKIYIDAGRYTVANNTNVTDRTNNRGDGRAGKETANGGLDVAGGMERDFPDENRGADFAKRGSSGTVKDNGGVGSY